MRTLLLASLLLTVVGLCGAIRAPLDSRVRLLAPPTKTAAAAAATTSGHLTKQVPIVSSHEDSYVRGVAGFGTELECYLNTCLPKELTVKWYKDNKLVAEGTDVKAFDGRAHIRHGITFDHTKDCRGKCSSLGPSCPPNHYCLENSCCLCDAEEFTLVLTNLTYDDAGTYRCQVDSGNDIEFDLEILEYGLMPSRRTYTFDHSECCEAEGVSQRCMPLCKPSMIEQHKFDPVPCENEYEKLLKCVTEGGNVSHVHCCQINFVPPFCWEFCHGRLLGENRRAGQFCIYWMPEIFDCYERAYLPFPGPPERLTVNAVNSSAILACWDPPKIRASTVMHYTVRYQEVPRFPFLGGGIPFLTGESEEMDTGGGPMLSRIGGSGSDGGNPFQSGAVGDVYPNRPMAHARRKRQSLLIMTHNLLTNETDIREYRFSEVNTTGNCAVIGGLKAATQYMMFVVAVNSYGTSLPTAKQTVSTDAVIYSNSTLPDVMGCCQRNLVSAECISKLCDLNDIPNAFGAFSIALTCRTEFAQVAPCLADGRNHTACCKARGVGGECLKLCDGTASDLGLASVLCLSLDMHAIYSCLREGYVTHPSPPTNFTVSVTGPQTAVFTWMPPETNNNTVKSYSLFVKEGNEPVHEIENVTSPYELVDLEANSIIRAYVIAHTDHGSSLKSSIVQFFTGVREFNFCEVGLPLRGATGELVSCYKQVDCPPYFDCTPSMHEDFDGYCCPSAEFLSSFFVPKIPDLAECCSRKSVPNNCMTLCDYNVTTQEFMKLHEECLSSLKPIVECAGDGRDHRPCCIEADVPDHCLDFCYSPLSFIGEHHESCLKHVVSIAKCTLHGVLKLPGPPQRLRVTSENSDWAKFSWDEPTQEVPVEFYELLLTHVESKQFSEYNTTDKTLLVTKLKPSAEYLAMVLAWNKHGSSVPSNEVTFTTRPAESDQTGKERPLSPHSVRKEWYRDRTANVSWEWMSTTYGGMPITQYKFNVLYRLTSSKDWKQLESNTTYALLSDLQPVSSYDLYVVAVDTEHDVSSYPSEIVEMFTWEESEVPEIVFVTSPRPPFQEGTKVSVTCSVRRGLLHNLTIEWGGSEVAYGRDKATFFIESIKSSDALRTLMCIGYSTSGQVVKVRHFLTVHFAPIVMTSLFSVFVYDGFNAQLECHVRSHPMMNVNWYFARNWTHPPEPVLEDRRHWFFVSSYDNPFSFNVTALVWKTTTADSGLYTCSCCNDLGCANGSVSLHVETLRPPVGPGTLLNCCKEKGVLENCLSACSVDIDVSVYEKNPQCMYEFPKLLQCAKDDIDHRQCCVMARVPSSCLAYCHQTDDDRPLDLGCLNFTSEILYCVQEGHRVLPAPPVSINVYPLEDPHSVNVSWVEPELNKRMYTNYIVYYQEKGSDIIEKVRTDKTFAVLSDLNASASYTISLVAANHNGFSSFGPVLEYSSATFGASSAYDVAASTSSSSAGVVFAIFFCLFVAFALVLSVLYFVRRPYHLPAFILKLKKRSSDDYPTSAVAFENPGYEREGQVRVLPANGSTSEQRPADDRTTGWDRAEVEAIQDSGSKKQSGLKYTRFR